MADEHGSRHNERVMCGDAYDGIVIYSDYDGTLTDMDDVLPRENIEAIRLFQSKGGRFSLATGKALEHYRAMPFTVNAPLILQNGMKLFDPTTDRWIRELTLDSGAIELATRVFEEFPGVGIAIVTDAKVWHLRLNECVRPVSAIPGFERCITPAELEQLDGSIIMVAFLGDDDAFAPVRDIIEREYPDMVCAITYPGFLDVMPRGVSKGAGLEYLKRHYFADEPGMRCIGVGDGENDVELLRAADVGVAVGGRFHGLERDATVVLDGSKPVMPELLRYIDTHLLDWEMG